MQTLIVTGGAGFIGSNFVRYMLDKYPDYRIMVLDALTYAGNLDNLADVWRNPRFSFFEGNINDSVLVNNLAQNADAIINFAAESHNDRAILDPEAATGPISMACRHCSRPRASMGIRGSIRSARMKSTAPPTASSERVMLWSRTSRTRQPRRAAN